MSKTITLPDPPSSWNALTKEQLIFIHSLKRSEMEEPVYKLQVFLHLAGLELCGESFYKEPEPPAATVPDSSTLGPTAPVSDAFPSEEHSAPVPEGSALGSPTPSSQLAIIQSQLNWMESVLDGTAPVTVVLRPTSGSTDLYSISDQDLFDAVFHFTKFLDDPYTLKAQPLGDITIRQHVYRTPAPLFSNLTHEQYQNAQYALQSLWNASQYIEAEQKKILEAEEKHKAQQVKLAKFGGKNYKPTPFTPLQENIDNINKGLEQIKNAQTEFLVHTLTCLQPSVSEEAVLDKEGKPSYTARGKAKIRQILHFEEPSIDVDKYSRNQKEEIEKYAPIWLFPILYQHFQSSLVEHKKFFPKLFSGSGGGGNDNQFVATISTLNTLMKEQGYNGQRAVLDANVVFNFQKLDELTRRAEEMKKMNDEIRRKSRKK